MHGQGNYNSQVGQGHYAPPSSLQQRPTNPAGPPPPPPFRHGPQPHVVQHGHPSFHLTPRNHVYQHGMPSAHDQGPPIPFPSSGMNSAQSHLTHPWSQNVRQLPPTAGHLPPRSAYSLPSSQWNTMERGPPHQPPFHAPPPPPPPYASSSSFMKSDPFVSSEPSIQNHSHSLSIRQLPPPPPPPPPPPSSPPRVPPLPPSSPPSGNLAKKSGICSLEEDLVGEDNLTLECPLSVKPAEDKGIHETEVLSQYTEKSGPEVRSADAIVAYSPADSDMDMEG